MSINNTTNIDDNVNTDTINIVAGSKEEDDNKPTTNAPTARSNVDEKLESNKAATNQKNNEHEKGNEKNCYFQSV